MIAKGRAFTLATMMIDAVCYRSREDGESMGDRQPSNGQSVQARGGAFPTVTNKLAKIAADGPLVLIEGTTSPEIEREREREYAHLRVVENHANDSRCGFTKDNLAPTLSSRMGTGGNNVPLILVVYE